MATFTQTLTSTVNFFGPQASTKWNTPMKWGTDQWGYDSHTTGNFFLNTSSNSFHNDLGPIFLDSGSFNTIRQGAYLNTAIVSNGSSQAEYLKDQRGYFYVLTGGNTNDDRASLPIYVKVPGVSNSWASVSSAPASWVSI